MTGNFLDVKEVLEIGTKIWARNNSGMKSGFSDLVDDLKRVIIKHLTSKEFMALVEANIDQDHEGTFKIALKVYYEDELQPGDTARKSYVSLSGTSDFVRSPAAIMTLGA